MAARQRQRSRSSIVVVANRLPVKRVKRAGKETWETSPGGLVTAIKPILQEQGGGWVGWPGTPDERLRGFTHDNMRLKPVMITARELEGFYEGFSNRTLWPLYHDSIRSPEFRRRWWWPYVEVNERFAKATAEVVDEGGFVWVQDYHLQLVPSMLRELRPDVRIGFFLHIPFPAEEIFARLPWRREVLRGLLCSDVIGFQSKLGARNFARAARQYAGAKGSDSSLEFQGRRVLARDFPISIDYARFADMAAADSALAKSRRLRAQLGHTRKIILGVDRLDYTKGIDVRLRAVEELFASGEVSVNEAVFVQIAVPSRENVEEYAEMRRQIEEIVGRINGTHSEPGLVAVHYLRRSLPQEDLVAYYMAADVMVVTPFRDGMNLVAKEYVACRSEEDGVLVLSEFTGAAHELKQAMLVNPFDIDATTATLRDALRMEPTEARRRMRALRRTVRRHDVYKWANEFLGASAA